MDGHPGMEEGTLGSLFWLASYDDGWEAPWDP